MVEIKSTNLTRDWCEKQTEPLYNFKYHLKHKQDVLLNIFLEMLLFLVHIC